MITTKKYITVSGILFAFLSLKSFGACSDAPRPYVDWRGCDKRNSIIGSINQQINLEGALLEHADFSNSKINAVFSDHDYTLKNVKFDNVEFLNSNFNLLHGMSNISFRGVKGMLNINSYLSVINNVNFDRAQLTSLIMQAKEISNSSFTNVIKVAQINNHITYFKIEANNLNNLDFSNSDLTGEPSRSNIAIIAQSSARNINLTNSVLRFSWLSENMLNNSTVNLTNTDLQMARIGLRECQKGSIGRCWSMRDLHPIE